MPLPRCFFDISINGIPTGRIVFELFTDVCPKTCQNFKCLCTGERGEGKTTFKPLHYKGTPIHRIVKGFIVQGGDFENGDGSGGESVYGGLFKDENFKLKHDKSLLLSMANKGPNTNGSQYFITTRPAPHLDGVHVVFGRVVSGGEFVTEMENQKVDSKNAPYADIRIHNCGELVLLKKGKAVKAKSKKVEVSSSSGDDSSSASESSGSEESSSSSSEEERRKKKRRRCEKKKERSKRRKKKTSRRRKKKTTKKKKKRTRASSSSSESDNSLSDTEEPTKDTEEGDLPPEVSSTRKSWLYRYSKSPSPVDGEQKKKINQQQILTERETIISSSGRRLRGRGNMRYRTPPPSREVTRWDYHQRSSDRERHRDRSLDRYRRHERSPDRYRHRERSTDKDNRCERSTDKDSHRERSPNGEHHRERSPDRSRLRERSPDRDRHLNKSPGRDKRQERSPGRDRHRERSSDRNRHLERPSRWDRRWERSPGRDRHRERSSDRDQNQKRSPDRDRRYRERSPGRDRHQERSPDRGRHHERSPDRHHERSPDVNQKHRHRTERYHTNVYHSPDTRNNHESFSPSQSSALQGIKHQNEEGQVITEQGTLHNEGESAEKTNKTAAEEEEDMTPPLYGLKEGYWEMDSNNPVIDSRARLDSDSKRSSRWDVGGPSDEDTELESAYQRVEQTLAEQQFGIGALIGEQFK